MKWRELEEANELIAQGYRIKVHDIVPWPWTWPWPLRVLARIIWHTALGQPIRMVLFFLGIGDPHLRLLVNFEVTSEKSQAEDERESVNVACQQEGTKTA